MICFPNCEPTASFHKKLTFKVGSDIVHLTMLRQTQLLSLLDKVLKQNARLRKGSEAVYFCPFCNHHKKKLEVNLDTQLWECWVCHTAGRSIRSLFKRLQANQAYYIELYKIIGKGPPQKSKEKGVDAPILSLPVEFQPMSRYSKSLEYACAYTYLKGRGVTKEDILRYNIGYCERGEYAKRIIIPSYDGDGNINFFSSRSYGENLSNRLFKYKNPSWSKDIIGFQLLINWGEPVTLVEGGFDAIAVRRNAIPLFGTMMSNMLKEAIVANGIWRVNILLDNDALSQAVGIYEFIERLSGDEIDVHLIKLDDKDPSVLGYEKVNEIIAASRPFGFKEMIRTKLNL